MPLPDDRRVLCRDCTRGGNGLDPNPCSCGWKEKDNPHRGCFLGERIPDGAPRKIHPKMTESQRRYEKWGEVCDCFPDWKFGDWLKAGGYRADFGEDQP